MPKTPDEIKKGLEQCIGGTTCRGCPYCEECAIASDCNPMHKDLQEYIRQLEAERDALINDIRTEGGLCALCKHESTRAWAEPCCRCNTLIISGESHWEWRGAQKEE